MEAEPDAECRQTSPEDEGLDLPVPELADNLSDKAALIPEQQTDDSLKAVREWADEGERGYGFVEDVLVHESALATGDVVSRIVVPTSRRKQILKTAHASLTAGHFSNRKTEAVLKQVFTWPGISKDVKSWCRACPECQKASKHISTPFQRMAFDLVGPMPRTKAGNKYFLTTICMGSRYPDAIPLKRVDGVTVAEAMMELFSRTGLYLRNC